MQKNFTYFNERVGDFEDRIRNFYLIYSATLKAAKVLEPAFLKQKYFESPELSFKIPELFKKINQGCEDPFNERKLF